MNLQPRSTRIFFLVFALVVNYHHQRYSVSALNLTDQCRQMGYKIESDLRAFVLIEHKSIIPNNEKAMDRYCKRAKAIPKQMKQFKQCVNNFSQQIINLITPNLSKAIRKMCITEKKEAMKHLQCLKPTHRPLIRKCFEKYSNELKMAAYQLNTIKEMLPHICCGFVETKSCVKQQLSNTCGSKAEPGGSAAAGYMSQLADAMGKEMVGVACARHTTPGKCDHLEPLPVPANLTSVLRDQFEHEFIVMPFIRVSERMVKSD